MVRRFGQLERDGAAFEHLAQLVQPEVENLRHLRCPAAEDDRVVDAVQKNSGRKCWRRTST